MVKYLFSKVSHDNIAAYPYKYQAFKGPILSSTFSKIFNLRIPKGVILWYIISLSESIYLYWRSGKLTFT